MTDTNRSTVTRWKALCEVCWPLPQSSVATQVAGTTAPIVDVVGRVLNATLLSRAPKVTGDSLFEALFDDKITPPLAELIAKQRGLPPLAPQPNPADYNPMLEPSWTPAMTIAWIAYRSDTEVVEVWDLYRCKCTFWLKRSLEFRKPATLRWMRMFEKSRPGAIGIHDAIQELLSALIGNKLQATGVKVDTRERVLLPGHEWHGLKFVDVRGCLVVRFRDGSLLTARGYDDVKFRSQDITEIWPARRLAMDGPPVPQAEPPAESAKPAALTEVTGEEAAADRELNDEGRATSARGSAETGESDAGKEPARSGGAGAAAEGQERKTDPAPAASLAKEEEEAETALDRRELNDAAVRAVITLVDTGGDVADACRQVAESLDAEGKRQFPHIKKWTSLRKAYYRKAGKVSLDTVSVSMDTGTDTPKRSTEYGHRRKGGGSALISTCLCGRCRTEAERANRCSPDPSPKHIRNPVGEPAAATRPSAGRADAC
jgi:hypothetical protein